MPNFSPTDAAFAGFRFTRERPAAIATWAAATLIFNLASAVFGALIGGSTLIQFQALAKVQPFNWSEFALLMPRLLPALAVTMVINMAGSAIIYPSAIRSFIGRDRKVTFHIGEDERRILVLLLFYGMIFYVVSSVTGICMGFLENMFGQFGLDTDSVGGRVAVTILSLFPPAAVIVRLSLAPVIAVDRKRISLKESWISTKGHFWPLAGSLLLSGILYLVIVFVGLKLGQPNRRQPDQPVGLAPARRHLRRTGHRSDGGGLTAGGLWPAGPRLSGL
jgi:hypothetical protein